MGAIEDWIFFISRQNENYKKGNEKKILLLSPICSIPNLVTLAYQLPRATKNTLLQSMDG